MPKVSDSMIHLGQSTNGASDIDLTAIDLNAIPETRTLSRIKEPTTVARNSSHLPPQQTVGVVEIVTSKLEIKDTSYQSEEWFHGVLPREEVVRLLVNDGDFLVRETVLIDTKQLVLSVCSQGYKHFIVQMTNDRKYRFEGSGCFSTIKELIMHQYQSGQPVMKSGAILRRPIPREKWELNNEDVNLIEKIEFNCGDCTAATNVESNDQKNLRSSANDISRAVGEVVRAAQAFYFLAKVSDLSSADVTNFSVNNRVIQCSCQQLTNTPSKLEKTLLAGIIIKNVTVLCDSCRIASSKILNPVARQKFVQSAKDLANASATLVRVTKHFEEDKEDYKNDSDGSERSEEVDKELDAEMKYNQDAEEPNENDQVPDSVSFDEDLVIPSAQTPSTVKHRIPHIPITEECPDVSIPTTPKKSKTTPSSYGYIMLYISVGFLVAVVVSVLGAIQYYKNGPDSLQISNFLSKTSPTSPKIDIPTVIYDLMSKFEEQPSMTFKIVMSALRKLNKKKTKGPVIIALLAEQGAADVGNRFAHQLAKSVSPYSDVVTISGHALSEQEPDTAKKAISDLLNKGLQENVLGAVFVDRLDYIPGDVALTFHTYCNNKYAPFKHVVYVMTVESNQTQLKLVRPNEWDTNFQEHLYKSWSVLEREQISSLLLHMDVSVVAIVSEGES